MQPVATYITTATAKQLTDDYIKNYCQHRIAESLALGASYVRLWQSIEKLVLAGGKRLRPYMVLATYQAYNPSSVLADVLPAAVAQELIHSAMLIHDDIIDRDSVRYGVKNVSGQYDEYYSQFFDDKNELAHMSLSAALLAGDALITDSHLLIRKTNRPVELVNEAEAILNNAIFEVIGGELLDIEIAFLPKGTINTDTISIYKTASYSFTGPLTTGAILAQAPEKDINTLKELSIVLGIGYQLRDDLLGTFGDANATGKSNTTDIREGKRTYLIDAFEQVATSEQSQTFFAHFHQPDASDDELTTLKNLLVETGARSAVEQLIEEKRVHALEKVQSLSLPDDAKKIYQDLIKQCLDREV
jgi:geranylgeranyl diphosphate synthase type II